MQGLHGQVEQFPVGRGHGAESVQQFGHIEATGGAVVASLEPGESVDNLGFGYGVQVSAARQGQFQQGQGLKVPHQLAGKAARGTGPHWQLAALAAVNGRYQVGLTHRGFAEGEGHGAVGMGQGHFILPGVPVCRAFRGSGRPA